jgi:hypothetical protein
MRKASKGTDFIYMYRPAREIGVTFAMAKTSSHRLVFKKDRFLNLGDAVPCGTRDDAGVRLPFGGRCMVDSIYHNEAAGQFVVTISHYPPEVKV